MAKTHGYMNVRILFTALYATHQIDAQNSDIVHTRTFVTNNTYAQDNIKS